MSKIKTIHRFNQNYKSFNFADLTPEPEEEFLEAKIELDSEGRILSELKYLDSGELEEENTYTYNAAGKLMSHVLYFATEDVTERRLMDRNEKGDLISETKMYGDDAGEKTEYQYDEKGNITAIVQYDEEGEFLSKEEIKYNDKGNVTDRIQMDSGNKVTGRTSYTYNGELEIEECEYDGNGSMITKTVAKFNSEGKELSSVQTNPQGKLISAVQNVFDDRGNVIEKIYKDFYSKKVLFTYDEQNRMIGQEVFDSSGLLLRRNTFVFDEEGNVAEEQTYEMDPSRGGRDKHFGTRYEYITA
ncbi:MAG: hypothetical protein IPP51_14525 [Bacteroidetes bacterium]|nr:hypothetical protein [Bacteroidota bacterium]